MHKKRFKRRLKNMFLKTVTAIAGLTWVFSAMALDSDNMIIPVTLNLVADIWLALFFYANQWYFYRWEKGEVG